MKTAIQIHPFDNVAVVTAARLPAGCLLSVPGMEETEVRETVEFGHKVAIKPILKGEKVFKYGFPIGLATKDIMAGQWVHTHNVETMLKGRPDYRYQKAEKLVRAKGEGPLFYGYERPDGSVGIRNELWVLPMVSCVNHTGQMIVREFQRLHPECREIFALEQPYGCSQLGEDHKATVRILQNIACHPNAGGVLLLSLGCENNVMSEFLAGLTAINRERLLTLTVQQESDELAAGVKLLDQLWKRMAEDVRTPQPVRKLRVGFKCGASDGFSGMTANPLAGRVCELLAEAGASVVLTEVPEMFGAEHILMSHAKDREVFEQIVELINEFKAYYEEHGQPIFENPSPGNKEGGITTLEEKSLGCIQKGGQCEITDVLQYGQRVQKPGLSLLCAPGNDPVSITAMASAGCQLLLFTTGRGNPLGCFVPTLKIASNTPLARRKKNWIDFDAGQLLTDASGETLARQLYQMTLSVASGETKTKSETDGYKEIGIFKTGVTL